MIRFLQMWIAFHPTLTQSKKLIGRLRSAPAPFSVALAVLATVVIPKTASDGVRLQVLSMCFICETTKAFAVCEAFWKSWALDTSITQRLRGSTALYDGDLLPEISPI